MHSQSRVTSVAGSNHDHANNRTSDSIELNAAAKKPNGGEELEEEEEVEEEEDEEEEEEEHIDSNDARWEETYNRLVAYRARHGNCLVPYRYPEGTLACNNVVARSHSLLYFLQLTFSMSLVDPKLGRWCK